MSEVLNVIKQRKSSRVPYDPNRQISKENLRQILEAARWAPTGHNMQNYQIIVVDDKAVLEKMGNIKSRVLEAFLRDNYEHLSFSEERSSGRKLGFCQLVFRLVGLTQPNSAKSHEKLLQYPLAIIFEAAQLF